jgi:hypothetical protein
VVGAAIAGLFVPEVAGHRGIDPVVGDVGAGTTPLTRDGTGRHLNNDERKRATYLATWSVSHACRSVVPNVDHADMPLFTWSTDCGPSALLSDKDWQSLQIDARP